MIQVNEPRNKLHPRYHRSILPLPLVESSSHLTTNDLYPNLIEHLAFVSSECFHEGGFVKTDSHMLDHLWVHYNGALGVSLSLPTVAIFGLCVYQRQRHRTATIPDVEK